MATYSVTFEVELPDGATADEVEKFIAFEVGASVYWSPETDALKGTDLRSCKIAYLLVHEA